MYSIQTLDHNDVQVRTWLSRIFVDSDGVATSILTEYPLVLQPQCIMSSVDSHVPPSEVPSGEIVTVVRTSTAFVEDYIALVSDGEGQKEGQQPKSEKAKGKDTTQDAPPANIERERDWGKVRERSREHGGGSVKKRKHDAVDFEDGYANKKQRMDAASRKVPWVYDIDWDECRNVAEM